MGTEDSLKIYQWNARCITVIKIIHINGKITIYVIIPYVPVYYAGQPLREPDFIIIAEAVQLYYHFLSVQSLGW